MSAIVPLNIAVGFMVVFQLQCRLNCKYQKVLIARCNGRRCRLLKALDTRASLTKVVGSKLGVAMTAVNAAEK